MFSSNQPVCWDTICQKLCLDSWCSSFCFRRPTQSQWKFLLTQTLDQSQRIHKNKWLYSLREEKLFNCLVKWDSSLDTDLDYWRRTKNNTVNSDRHHEIMMSKNSLYHNKECPLRLKVWLCLLLSAEGSFGWIFIRALFEKKFKKFR